MRAERPCRCASPRRRTAGEDVEFGASGTVITFPGFLAAYEVGKDEDGDEDQRPLPNLQEGQAVETKELTAQGHSTSPPPRYTEATLVRALEERGIGRPSTYAAIMSTVMDRGYAFKRGTALVPSFLAFSVTELLEKHFSRLVDYEFTARMEDDLDRIAAGDEGRVEWLRRFYFGDGEAGRGGAQGARRRARRDRRARSQHVPDPRRRGHRRFASGATGRTSSAARSARAFRPTSRRTSSRSRRRRSCSRSRQATATSASIRRRAASCSRAPDASGPYVTEVLPEDDKGKPKTASLFKSMSLDTVTHDDAVKLLSLPRVLGPDPADGEDVEALNGRFGPYIKKGTETRSLETEEQLFTITLEEALELLAKPKERRRRGAAAGPLRELGVDPITEKKIVVRKGRFGPYVTDGETNASLRAGDEVESLTHERAIELLADRRARGPAQARPQANSRVAETFGTPRRLYVGGTASRATRNGRGDGIRSLLFETSIVGIRLRFVHAL